MLDGFETFRCATITPLQHRALEAGIEPAISDLPSLLVSKSYMGGQWSARRESNPPVPRWHRRLSPLRSQALKCAGWLSPSSTSRSRARNRTSSSMGMNHASPPGLSSTPHNFTVCTNGVSNGVRTRDLQIHSLALYLPSSTHHKSPRLQHSLLRRR